MDSQFLARWHAVCALFKGPFKDAKVIVNKQKRTAELTLQSPGNPDHGTAKIMGMALSTIGTDDRDYREIGQDIITVARQEGLLDENSNAPVISE